MEHDFKVGDIVQMKSGSPDLTVIAVGLQSVSVACYDDDARANGTASNFNGTFYWDHLERVASVNTPDADAKVRKGKKKVKATDDKA